MTRRFSTLHVLSLALVLILCAGVVAAQTAQVPLPGNKIPAFVDSLPLLSVSGGTIQTVLPSVLGGTDSITLKMIETQTNMMPTGFVPANGQPYTGTWVFRYVADADTGVIGNGGTNSYIGPVIVAARNHPTEIKYVNNLTANNIHWREWTDQSLHSAFHQIYGIEMPTTPDPNSTDPTNSAFHYPGPVPAVPHLHGGEDPAVIDGGPEAYFLSDQGNFSGVINKHGPAYYSKAGAAVNEAIYRYPNTQEASPLWFHDHLLGGTRLNATFGGLAGAYALIDPGLTLPTGLHPVGLQNLDETNLRYTIPLVIQDRMFDTNGQLYFPNAGINPTVHPYWIPEFVGDVIVVNGKVWPYLNVDQQRYRFYLINGSNSTPYEMFLQDLDHKVSGPRFWVIATDGGYLDTPVLVDPNATGAQTMAGVRKTLVMMPGERYEIIIDFNDQVWKNQILPKRAKFPLNLVLRNIAPTVEGNPPSSTAGRIMQFRVSANAPTDTSYNPATGTPIRSSEQAIKRLANPATGTANFTADKTRELVLVEIAGPGGPLEVLVNNTKWDGMSTDTSTFPDGARPDSTLVPGIQFGKNYLTELPTEGQIEIWEIVNTTMDSHPIHLHAIQFQILNREPYDAAGFFAAYSAAFPGIPGDPVCTPGVFCPGYGPPLNYSTGNSRALGGNPDVTPFLLGPKLPPLNYEAGWKDTAIMHPGEVTRIAVRFAPQDVTVGTTGSFTFDPSALNGVYVWHCHITDHEDNEMMRPYQILSNTSSRSYVQGTDY